MVDYKKVSERGIVKIKKDTTYASLIIDAINESPEGKCTTPEIFNYLMQKYPKELSEKLFSIWSRCIQQILSKDSRFIKLGKRQGCKYSEWIFFPYSSRTRYKRPQRNFFISSQKSFSFTNVSP
ncbi:hypothetical protein NEOKW01_1833 [Nematocida sp. AWRm80]|nr:hypothetical protein NEOKW01_1833 [Nematocida sp. AWRm80]